MASRSRQNVTAATLAAVQDERDQPPVFASRGRGGALEVAAATVAVLEGKLGPGAAAATVVGRSGSAPQVVGAKLLLLADGTLIGTIGGGAIEAQVVQACRATLRDGQTRRIQAHLVRDLGMCCGGAMEVFVEYVQPETRLLIIGAGHVARALVPVAQAAGFRTVVIDDRDELFEHPSFANAVCLPHDVDELAVALPDLYPNDYVVIATRDHPRDETALTHLLGRPHRYLGMIGSRRKVHTILQRILRRAGELGHAPPDLARLRAPVGLALGGRTPGEIAISIMAEILAERHGGSSQSMDVTRAIDATDKEVRSTESAEPDSTDASG